MNGLCGNFVRLIIAMEEGFVAMEERFVTTEEWFVAMEERFVATEERFGDRPAPSNFSCNQYFTAKNIDNSYIMLNFAAGKSWTLYALSKIWKFNNLIL